jgi:hypothetical protein
MTLTVADIDRWDAEAVRAVLHAADSRGHATMAAARQLGALAVFDTWEGATAEARQHTIASIRHDLDAHGSESLAVARAAGKAADEIEGLQSTLRALRHDAAELRMTIDAIANKVVPSSPKAAPDAETQLQPRLDAIVAQANTTDQALASAISATDEPVTPPEKPLPRDPGEFSRLWNRLSPEEKDRLYRQDPTIGNHPGMPWDPADHLGKDHYNRLQLVELERQAESDMDRIQRSVEELMAGRNVDDGALYALQAQLAAARKHLDGYRAVDAVLNSTDGPRRYLGQIDAFGHGAVSVGNPDTAKRNAIFVPGTGQDLARLRFSDEKSLIMYRAALKADPRLASTDVAVTTWIGYDPPMNLGQAAFPDHAKGGADSLDAFEDGLRASHVGPPSIDTVIGHSYGSTVVGAAASGGHHLHADNIIAVGSPGMLVDRANRLNLNAGADIYVMRAANDIIGLGGGVTEWTLGADPTAPGFGAKRLMADPGLGGPFWLPSIGAHSGYWSNGNKSLANFGAVIAGVPPPYLIGRR